MFSMRRFFTQYQEKILSPLGLFLIICTVTAVLSSPWNVTAQGSAKTDVDKMIQQMSVEERVGQLFLVTFVGSDVTAQSDIGQLVNDYHVGGVLLLPENGNFRNEGNTLTQVITVTNRLQMLAYANSKETGRGPYVPLFVAVDQEGNGYPHTAIRNGLTPLPSNMAIGATWNLLYAKEVGHVVGSELRALGINMLLGPSLDVVTDPRPGQPGDMETRTFGGDPYWVGKLGSAYIRGVHLGSENRVAVVVKHFPGLGNADRRPDEEIATIQESLQALRSVELIPFFSVTEQGEGEDTLGLADALMTSHIRYRGFQGNIRQLTRPVSLDAPALHAILEQPELSSWRNTGLLVSDALGVPAIQKFYDPTLQTFPNRRIALEAFLAGNDLLTLSHFGLTDDWTEQFENIKSTILFFQEKYKSDRVFRSQADAALRRILLLKRSLYPDFTVEHTLISAQPATGELLQGQDEISKLAKEAVTLIYPGPDELADRLPSPPLSDENILIFSDSHLYRECADCTPFPAIPTNALEKTILRLYGPDASRQISPSHVRSFSFRDLKTYVQSAEEKRDPTMKSLIQQADWIVLAMLDVNPTEVPDSDAVKLFLRESADTLRNHKVVVIGFGAPYYLDATEISKLTAYYAVYSKTSPFIEASVRALFQEFTPHGASPVSIRGANYNLIDRTAPDPNQVIQISVGNVSSEDKGTAVPIGVKVGTELRLHTSVILDRNGHPVPDGTPVTFILSYPSESLELPRQIAPTVHGIASTTVTLERVGDLEITALSDPADRSTTVLVSIEADKLGTIATRVPPTPTATKTPLPTSTPNPSPTSPPAPAATVTAVPPGIFTPPAGENLGLGVLLLSLAGMGVAESIGLWIDRGRYRPVYLKLRTGLWALGWGLGGYIAYGLGAIQPLMLAILPEGFPAWAQAPLFSSVLVLLAMAFGLWSEAERD